MALSAQELCSQRDLQVFLVESQYKLHPCKEFAQRLELELSCQIFAVDIPMAVEVSDPSCCPLSLQSMRGTD